ncbi:Uncharacterised protein [Serratia rubidaea]|uniref:Uncharacterized protein n=1 Tax=Serratia rubidaea TaxID=61652 RepID=A0A4U9HER9_SERRU|nr:Uncharacterised protein [Serratia rubidaea]
MKSENRLETASGRPDKDESIYQALLSAIVEHQLPPGSKLPEERCPRCSRQPHRVSAGRCSGSPWCRWCS